jgi:hypothetical protein
MRFNYKPFALKNISRDDKEKISTDILLGSKTDYLKNVDLATDEGKQKFIKSTINGEKLFKSEQEIEDENVNKIDNITSSWNDILDKAIDNGAVIKADDKSEHPFQNPLVNTAFLKKIRDIQSEIYLSKAEISRRMLEEYENNSSAKKDTVSAIKFFYKMSSSIFTECDMCGKDNAPDWIICQHCGNLK